MIARSIPDSLSFAVIGCSRAHHDSFCFKHYPQQLLSPLLQSHDGGPPLIRLLMTAAAHPTPDFTVIAPNSQF